MGDKTIDFEFLSNQSVNFPSSLLNRVNYEDPNINISIPVFTIHGNHDDVINNASALDVLSSTGLVNYFGHWRGLDKIQVTPVILQKNNTKIALYGLNHIPDRRLNHLMNSKAFEIGIPDAINEMFSVFVLHQNRADRGARNYIMETMLPSFLNIVIWGHEHDCRIDPEPCKDTYIIQPGSSVATSLSEGESIEKKVGILEVRGKEFKMTPILLRTVRPFIFKSIDIKECEEDIAKLRGETRDRVEKVLDKVIEEMLKEAKTRVSGHSRQPKLPLLRLRVCYDDNQYLINTKRYGQKYAKVIANSDNVLHFKKNIKRNVKQIKTDPDQKILNDAIKQREKQDRVEDVVESYFKKITDEKQKLQILNLESLSEACRILVDRDDEQGATNLINTQIEEACRYLIENSVDEEEIKTAIKQYNEQESKNAFNKGLEILASRQNENVDAKKSDDDGDDVEIEPPPKATRGGRGRGGARASTSRAKANVEPRMSIKDQLTQNRTLRSMQQNSVISSDEDSP